MSEFHLQTTVGCGVLLVLVRDDLPFGTAHTKDVLPHRYLLFVSTLFRIYGVQQGLCRTSRSVCSLALGVPRSTYHLSAWGIRDGNRGARVSSAFFHLAFEHKKSPRRIAPTKAFCILFVHYNYIIRAVSTSINLTLHFADFFNFFHCLIVDTKCVLHTEVHIHRNLLPGLETKVAFLKESLLFVVRHGFDEC